MTTREDEGREPGKAVESKDPIQDGFDREAALERLRAIKDAVEDLERLLAEGSSPTSPYARRREVLELIYLSEGMDKEDLLRVLREHGAQYQWIAMQVKKEYLSVNPLPGGRTRYTVTPKAVRELRLDQAALWE